MIANLQSYQKKGLATWAKRGALVGLRDAIIRYMKSRRTPPTPAEIAKVLGAPEAKIRNSLGRMTGTDGGVIAIGEKGAKRYALYDSPAGVAARKTASRGPFAIPVPYAPPFRPLRRDPFELMKLAMETRRS